MTTEILAPEDQRSAAIEANMEAAGIPITEKVQEDYFAFDEVGKIMLPDGVSWVQHQVLNEGKRKAYLKSIQRDITFRKASGDAQMRMSSGEEKSALLQRAIVGWNLQRNGADIKFNDGNLQTFLDSASPKVVDLIHKEVSKANPWLLAEMTVEDIDKEIEELKEMRERIVDANEGKADS